MKRICLCASIGLLVACGGTKHASITSQSSSNLVTDGKLWSSVFQQKAAEYKALCIQAYNIARLRLEERLKQGNGKPLAIVTDIDETALDNSPYAVHQGLQGKDYDVNAWTDWTTRAMADTLPGSVSFFNFASHMKVEVFYITNRSESEKEGTLQNLRRFHFPFADEQHLLLKKDVSSKESRRQQVQATYEIVLLLGDNLTDFSALFDGRKTTAERGATVQELASAFGDKFIILPNSNYGGWEDALYGNNFGLTPMQKDSAIRSNLKGY